MYEQASISDIADVVTGKTPSTKDSGLWEPDIPFITPKDLQTTKHIATTDRHVSNAVKDRYSKQVVPAGSVCVSCIGNLGYVGVTEVTSLTNQQINTIVPNDPCDSDYLYYAMRWLWPYFKHLEGQSTTLSIINKSQFKRTSIPWPNQRLRQRISDILNRFDDMIELNLRTNDYLAELLDVLFVDMLNDADASWERLSLLDIASYKNGLAMQKFRPAPGDPGLPVLKIKELGQGVCTPDSERCASTIDESVKIHDGNLVFSWSGTLLLDFWAGGDAGLNQHLFKVTSDRYPSWLYYLWTKHHMDRFIMLAKDRATTMGHIKRSALAESEVLIPPVEQLEVLTRRMQPIVDELVVNKIQSRNLAGLRDVLLPKLMSGEIDVSNVRLSTLPNNHLV
ncbi:restriction endonuclease subunit S [Enorma phocaeensis]|uniref:restriction endonuclease subunit S n=1 Tax=Enorma phocaeensis TaxID=1871019 RepID=UPI00195E8372|nr:restriction endonuclease subunit S [Enorma phocaeensis]